MEENREDIIQNNEESIETKAEDTTPAAENVVDDDIQYTFVVPKGEIYRDPDLLTGSLDLRQLEPCGKMTLSR